MLIKNKKISAAVAVRLVKKKVGFSQTAFLRPLPKNSLIGSVKLSNLHQL
jgi:hypothetical protein